VGKTGFRESRQLGSSLNTDSLRVVASKSFAGLRIVAC